MIITVEISDAYTSLDSKFDRVSNPWSDKWIKMLVQQAKIIMHSSGKIAFSSQSL